MNQPKIVLRTEYAPDYKRIAVTSFIGQVNENGFELTALVDEGDFTPQVAPAQNSVYIRRRVETKLVINPIQAKLLHGLLGDHIQQYESIHGKIPSPAELQQKVAELQAKSPIPQSDTTSNRPTFGVQ